MKKNGLISKEWEKRLKNLMDYMLITCFEKMNRNPFEKHYDTPYSSYNTFKIELENIFKLKQIEEEINA